MSQVHLPIPNFYRNDAPFRPEWLELGVTPASLPRVRFRQQLTVRHILRLRQTMTSSIARQAESHGFQVDTTFEIHYSVGDLAKQWRLGRETVRLLVKDEPSVLKIRLARQKAMTRYSVPESVARRVHTKLFNAIS